MRPSKFAGTGSFAEHMKGKRLTPKDRLAAMRMTPMLLRLQLRKAWSDSLRRLEQA